MSNSTTVQIIEDGYENTVLKFEGVLDTSDLGSTTVADPATLADMGPRNGVKATQLRIKKIIYNIEDSLSVRLLWDATTDLRIEDLVGRGEMDFTSFGGLQNNSGAGKTGTILATTQGWATSAILSFSIILHLGKQ